MQYRKDKQGNAVSVLGYGCMRFSKKGNSIDIDKAEKEIAEGKGVTFTNKDEMNAWLNSL